jgi:CRP-like cAMP-binding protein
MISGKIPRLFLSVIVVAILLWTFVGNSFAADQAKASELYKALRQAKLFTGLTDEEISALESVAILRHCKAGERIIEQAKSLDRMFIIPEGLAEINVDGEFITILPVQSLVGEVEFLDGLPASANVVILKETSLIELNNTALTELMNKRPRIGYVLMSEIARIEGQRLRAMDQSKTLPKDPQQP